MTIGIPTTKMMIGVIKTLLLCALLLGNVSVFAQDLDDLRKNFRYAEAAIKKGDLTTYYKLKPELKDYILYPYLQYAEITRMMGNSLPTDHVKKFINTYPGSSLAIRMQANWLKTLAKQQQWSLYQQFYKPSDDIALQCYSVWAEYKNSQKASVLNKAKPLWLSAYSRPDACNALFAAWQKTSSFNSDVAFERAQLAMDANQAKIVTYLKRFLNAQQLASVDAWFKMYDLKQAARNNTETALKNWHKTKNTLTEQAQGEVIYAFALELATDHDKRAIDWLNQVPKNQMDTPVYEWRVRYALRQQDWANVLTYIDEMPKDLKEQSTWRYWQARALLALDKNEQANALLKTLATERHYYGMLASELINAPHPLNHAVYPVKDSAKSFVDNDAGIKRAVELYAINHAVDARREWNTSIAKFNEEQLHAAAHLAQSMKWYDRGILTATAAVDRNDLDVRFPLAYEKDMRASAQKNNLDLAWVFAISRQESAFIPDAQSTANAMGVMQLLPSTAQLVAKSMGQTFNKHQLIVPEKNISYGTRYLKDMLKKFNQNRQLASAAYNAGASRVYRWLPDDKLPTDIWVETIPFKETRGYVQNVSSFWVIYNHQLGMKDKRLNHFETYISAL